MRRPRENNTTGTKTSRPRLIHPNQVQQPGQQSRSGRSSPSRGRRESGQTGYAYMNQSISESSSTHAHSLGGAKEAASTPLHLLHRGALELRPVMVSDVGTELRKFEEEEVRRKNRERRRGRERNGKGPRSVRDGRQGHRPPRGITTTFTRTVRACISSTTQNFAVPGAGLIG
jgi:hypothetical protein